MTEIIASLGLERVMITVGIFVLGYSMHLTQDLKDLLGKGKLKEAWDTPSILMGYLIAGYTAVLYNDIISFIDSSFLTSLVFFFGAFLVWVTAYYNNQVFDEVVQGTE